MKEYKCFFIFFLMGCSIYKCLAKLCYQPNNSRIDIETIHITPIYETESVEISSALCCNRKSFETISQMTILKNNIKHFTLLTNQEKENLKTFTENEKIELILLYNSILHTLKREYIFFPIEKVE